MIGCNFLAHVFYREKEKRNKLSTILLRTRVGNLVKLILFNKIDSQMRIFFAAVIFLCVTVAALGQEKNQYLFSYFVGNGEDGLHLAHSEDGYLWKPLNEGNSYLTPSVGKDKLMRDPSILLGVDGMFHMVWTVSWGEKGIGYSSSKDLIHWTEQQYIPVMEHEANARNCWAPELFYDKDTQLYYIFWATTITGKFKEGEEQKYNHRLYYVTTKDFISFTPTRLFYNHKFSVIDAAIIHAANKYVMFLKDETDKPNIPEKNIRIATSDKAEGPYTKPGKSITGSYWAEGPAPINIKGKWFVYFDKYTQHKYGVITSTDLENWTDESEKISMPAGIRHGTAFEVSTAVVNKLIK